MKHFESKAYKILYEKYKSIYFTISHKVKTRHEYFPLKTEEEEKEFLKSLFDTSKYDYYGIASKEDLAIIKVLEECLEDKK